MFIRVVSLSRLVWNDEAGYIGFIGEDGAGERKVNTITSGGSRYAVTVYKVCSP